MWELCMRNSETKERRYYFGHGPQDCYNRAVADLGSDIGNWDEWGCDYID